MPNWCDNHVEISAKSVAELNEFISFCSQTHETRWNGEIKQEQGVFWTFISPENLDEYWGTPDIEISDLMKQAGIQTSNGDWYWWNVNNWDTKWDIQPDFDEVQENSDGTAFMNWNFNTAWSPPRAVYQAMAERFPNLEFQFQFSELGMCFAGLVSYRDGKLINEVYCDDVTHDEYLNELGFTCCDRCGTDAETCQVCECGEQLPCEWEDCETKTVSADANGEA
jgi:hypothetical protein